MAVETGSANDVYDLLDKLETFASAQGWTVNKSTSDELYLQNGSGYWVLKAADNAQSIATVLDTFPGEWAYPGVACRGATGFDTGAAWDAQPGDSAGEAMMAVFDQTDVKAYWFMTNAAADYIHVIARRDAQHHLILMMGTLEKFGTWTGGAYLASKCLDEHNDDYGEMWPFSEYAEGTFIRADIDGRTDAWHQLNETYGNNRWARGWRGGFEGRMASSTPSTWNGRSPLWPMTVFLERGDSTYSYAGYPPDVRSIIGTYLEDGQEFVVGSDTWLYAANMAFRKVP